MKERPILFSGPMVRAILEGRKTQTRRVMKPQPERNPHSGGWRWHPPTSKYDERYDMWLPSSQWLDGLDPTQCGAAAIVEFGPFGVRGDRLWVRETWGITAAKTVAPFTQGQVLEGEYDILRRDLPLTFWYRADDPNYDVMSWRPSIHMPRVACRITLEITDVRVQRLQDISEADAAAEGVGRIELSPAPLLGEHMGIKMYGHPATSTHVHAFRVLWDEINGNRGFGWDANPWVWAITFKRV